jgi:hypothetical protein
VDFAAEEAGKGFEQVMMRGEEGGRELGPLAL